MKSFWNPKRKKISKKNMSWDQAKARHPKLSPFGDVDKDGVKNWLDCKPFDKRKQDKKEDNKFTKEGIEKEYVKEGVFDAERYEKDFKKSGLKTRTFTTVTKIDSTKPVKGKSIIFEEEGED